MFLCFKSEFILFRLDVTTLKRFVARAGWPGREASGLRCPTDWEAQVRRVARAVRQVAMLGVSDGQIKSAARRSGCDTGIASPGAGTGTGSGGRARPRDH